MSENKNQETFLELSLDRVISDRFGRYSKYIIQDRALPDARDGLKPVQRRILYSMNDLGLLFNKAYKKSARVVGDVIGKYHPHGDSSIYEAMVRMSQSWKMNIPLIQMHGNNGSIDDDPAAAMRYTEARLSKISHTLLNNIKKDTVQFAPNFDDSEREPTVLPALFPNLLTNGAKGIAAGYATEMPPHNLGEVIDAIIAKIKSPNIRLETLLSHIKGPDFPTGGSIQGSAGIYQAFERGRGKLIIRSKYEVIDLKTKPAIVISEIPYGVIKAKLVRDIDEIRFNNKISGIKEVRDETDRNGISIVIELMPGTNPNLVENYLLSKTDLQVYYNYNNVAIKNKVPVTMSLIDLIDAYLVHQREIQTKSLNFDLAKFSQRLEIVEGLIKVSKITDQVIETIKKSEGSRSGVVKNLMATYNFTELQAQAIAELRLYRLSRTDQSLYLGEANELTEKIAGIKNILASPENLDIHLSKLLRDLKKEYAIPRRTQIISGEMETISINMEDLIKHEDAWVGVTKDGYIKRFSNRAYEANKIETYALKERDTIKHLSFMNTSDKLLIFTSKGNYFFIPVHKIVEAKYKDIGKHINDFAAIPVDEKIISAIPVSSFNVKANIVQATKLGKIKVTPIKSFEVTRFTKTYKAFKLGPGDEVIDAKVSNGFKEVILITSDGQATRYNERILTSQGTKASGAKGINVKNNFVTSLVLAHDQDIIGLVSKRGGMKRIKLTKIQPMNRTTRGKQIFREIKGNPHIIADAQVVSPQTKALYFTTKITINEFKESDITSSSEGLSLIGPPQTFDAKILVSYKVDAIDEFIQYNDSDLGEEAKFEKAEKAIDDLDQLSLDDLLKDL